MQHLVLIKMSLSKAFEREKASCLILLIFAQEKMKVEQQMPEERNTHAIFFLKYPICNDVLHILRAGEKKQICWNQRGEIRYWAWWNQKKTWWNTKDFVSFCLIKKEQHAFPKYMVVKGWGRLLKIQSFCLFISENELPPSKKNQALKRFLISWFKFIYFFLNCYVFCEK